MHVHQPHLWKNPLLWHLHRSPQRLHLGLFWEGDLAIISVLFRLIVYKHIKGAIWQLSVLSSDWFCTNTLRGQFDNYQCPVQIDYVETPAWSSVAAIVWVSVAGEKWQGALLSPPWVQHHAFFFFKSSFFSLGCSFNCLQAQHWTVDIFERLRILMSSIPFMLTSQ